jgi:hypothetical protein
MLVARVWNKCGFMPHLIRQFKISNDLQFEQILDYGTHKYAKVNRWLKKNSHVTLHFIPTSSSWLNLVEQFFGLITVK